MITVHHLEHSRSQRVLWLLEELGLDYEIELYKRDPKTMLAPKSLRDIHPLGKAPVISDGDLILPETGAIIDYLLDAYGGGRLIPGAGTPERQRYGYWMHYAEGSLMPPLLLKLVFLRMSEGPMPFFMRPLVRSIAGKVQNSYVDPLIARNLDYLEGEIVKTGWFAGNEFSAADVMMSFPLEGAASRGVLDASRPGLQDFLSRIHARSAYQAALERGGPYALLR